MDLIEDEPRHHPKPMPFCQKALIQPMVPEVSLLLQDNFQSDPEKKNDSFSGTEFQTYNSWRWKHIYQNRNNRELNFSNSTELNKDINGKDPYLIKDKYFASDIEKRKNEILYGDIDEPRRPLPPRTDPVIPTSIKPFFSERVFEDPKPVHLIQGKPQKAWEYEYVQEDNVASSCVSASKNLTKETDNAEKLYSIISEQNKQMQNLQNQIDQLLKLQEIKDKQIEQLLNSQESKEKKIEQLMETLDSKNKEVEQFLGVKEKQELHLQELMKSNEIQQKENLNLVKKLNELKQKEMLSVAVMANVQVADASTCANLDDFKESDSKNTQDSVEDISCIRNASRLEEKEKSISLHSSDLPVIQENVPTPQSSIHLDIQDFPDSSDESEIEAGTPCNSIPTDGENQPKFLGCTFYNNVLTQLQEIIKNTGEKEITDKHGQMLEKKNFVISKPSTENEYIVKNKGTVKSFHSWNVFEKENVSSGNQEKKRIQRILEKPSKLCLQDPNSPSDISLKINALALKYLKQEQISQCGVQSQIPTSYQHDVTIYNVTNLSFGSMKYLDRYQMLPNITENQKHVIECQKNECSPVEFLHGKTRMRVHQNITSSIGNVLDINALNPQPKFL